jgi:hypothetical protein
VIKLGVVPDETVEPVVGTVTGGSVGVAGGGVGMAGGGVGVTVGLAGGEKMVVDVTTVAVGAVGLESSQPPAKRVNRTTALIRFIPHARATVIPRRCYSRAAIA